MSKSILIVSHYNNNKTVQRGLFDGINNDSENSPFFTPTQLNSVFAFLDADICGRKIKRVEVVLSVSGSKGGVLNETIKYDTLNDAENDLYKFLDKLNFSN